MPTNRVSNAYYTPITGISDCVNCHTLLRWKASPTTLVGTLMQDFLAGILYDVDAAQIL